MSGKAFDYAKQLYQEKRELEEKVKTQPITSVSTNPDSFTSAPQFQQLVEGMTAANVLEQAWQDQAARLEAGEPAVEVIMDEQGNLQQGRQLEPNPQTKVAVQQQLANIAIAKQNLRQEADKFKQEYVQQVNQYKEFFSQVKSTLFKGYEGNPEVISRVKEAIPPAVRELPEVQFAILSYSALQDMTGKYQDLVTKVKALLEKRKQTTKSDKTQMPSGETKGNSSQPGLKSYFKKMDAMVNGEPTI
jgi:hypothetical protein